jgi:hypothetical protein
VRGKVEDDEDEEEEDKVPVSGSSKFHNVKIIFYYFIEIQTNESKHKPHNETM